MRIEVSKEVADLMQQSLLVAKKAHFLYVTPELLLYVMCQNQVFAQAFENCGGTLAELDADLRTYLEEYVETCAEEEGQQERVPEFTHSAGQLLADAICIVLFLHLLFILFSDLRWS